MAEWYEEYLQTDRWRQLRLQCFARDDYTCQFCHQKLPAERLNAHHTSYDHMASEDEQAELFDLITLCRECHQRWHDNMDHAISLHKQYSKIDVALALPALPATIRARDAEIKSGAELAHSILKGCPRGYGIPNKVYALITNKIEQKRGSDISANMYTLRDYIPNLYEGIQKAENSMYKREQRGDCT